MSLSDDRVVNINGDLNALRRRMATDHRFRFRRHELFTTIFTTPLTIEMVLGDQSETLRTFVNAVRELHGPDVEIVFDSDSTDVVFTILKWRDEAQLRSLDQRANEPI